MSFLDPRSEPERQSLIDLRNGASSALHKTLLDGERRTYERVHGPIGSPGAFLQLLLNDPWFAWLRPMTSLVVVIDEALAAKEPVTEQAARQFSAEAKLMLSESEGGRGIQEKPISTRCSAIPTSGVLHGEIMKIYSAQTAERR